MLKISMIIIVVLVYITFNSIRNTFIILFTIPVSLLGGLVYVYYMNFNLSIAVVIGFLALFGVAVSTAIVMLIYIEDEIKKIKENTKEELFKAIYSGAVLRVRPKIMTVSTILLGLIPLMYIEGVGSEVMQRIAAPMIGGIISSAILTLIVIPSIYAIFYEKKYR